MNEMRKLMEAVEQLDEAKPWWYNEEKQARANEVLQYFSNKKEGGRIKPGYKAFMDIDGHNYEIETINILRRRGERPEVSVSGPHTPGYQVGMQGLAEIEIYKLERVL